MNNSPSKNLKHIYFENLDACRFLAAFSVFLFHFSNEVKGTYPSIVGNTFFAISSKFMSKGHLGVNFFFVLSGFLITYLILAEIKNSGSFSLGKFLIRRTLRIWPLYFIIVLIGFVLFPLLIDGYSTQHNVYNYLLFLANFDEIKYGLNDSINFLTAPWSVAVEEQFYLFWGIALFFLFKVKWFKLPYLLALLYISSFYFRWSFWEEERILYYHTLAVCQDILTGAFIAWSLFEKKTWLNWVQQLPKWLVALIYFTGFGICLLKNNLLSGQLVVFERFVLSLFFGFIILDQIRGEYSILKLGRFNLLNYLGKISYGIYMYHLVVMFLICRFTFSISENKWLTVSLFFITSVLITFMISALSYRYFESKFLSLKPSK